MTLYRKYRTRSGWKLAADKCRDVWAAIIKQIKRSSHEGQRASSGRTGVA